MAYPTEIQLIVKRIPKEYHKDIQKIITFYHSLGVQDTQNLLKGIIEISPEKINEYGVWHDSAIDGG